MEDRKCSVCGEPLFLCYRDIRDYAYKTKQRGFAIKVIVKYQCSYKCYLKAKQELNVLKKRMVK